MKKKPISLAQRIMKSHFLMENGTIEGEAAILMLDDEPYKIHSYLRGSEEAHVYAMENIAGELFALKIYQPESKREQEGDLLAFDKAQKSRLYMRVPVAVNPLYGYSIFPLLTYRYTSKPDEKKLEKLKEELQKALTDDGLTIGDIENTDNYMYDETGRLLRINLETLKRG